MQSSQSFDWPRVVTVLRWIARVLGVVAAAILVLVALLNVASLGGGAFDPITGYVTWGLMAVGLLVAAFWVGIGEVAGGLTTVVGAVLTFTFVSTPNLGSLVLLLPFALIGVLFIACGWYTLAHRQLHAPPATA